MGYSGEVLNETSMYYILGDYYNQYIKIKGEKDDSTVNIDFSGEVGRPCYLTMKGKTKDGLTVCNIAFTPTEINLWRVYEMTINNGKLEYTEQMYSRRSEWLKPFKITVKDNLTLEELQDVLFYVNGITDPLMRKVNQFCTEPLKSGCISVKSNSVMNSILYCDLNSAEYNELDKYIEVKDDKKDVTIELAYSKGRVKYILVIPGFREEANCEFDMFISDLRQYTTYRISTYKVMDKLNATVLSKF